MIFRNATAQTLRDVSIAPIVSELFYESTPVTEKIGYILVSGVWKNISNAYTIVSGVWKNITEVNITVSEQWKKML